MARYAKDWSAQWNGHIIRVENRAVKWQQIETHLSVDGALIQQHKGDLWHSNIGCAGEFEDENGMHSIRIKFHNSSSVAALCHIYINDELIGGDRQTPLPLTEEDIAQLPVAEQKKRLKRIILWQLAVAFIYVPLIYVLLGLLFSTASSDPVMFVLSINSVLFSIVSNIYQLLKLSMQNPTDEPKNSTPV